jgi:hypothetical protein
LLTNTYKYKESHLSFVKIKIKKIVMIHVVKYCNKMVCDLQSLWIYPRYMYICSKGSGIKFAWYKAIVFNRLAYPFDRVYDTARGLEKNSVIRTTLIQTRRSWCLKDRHFIANQFSLAFYCNGRLKERERENINLTVPYILMTGLIFGFVLSNELSGVLKIPWC